MTQFQITLTLSGGASECIVLDAPNGELTFKEIGEWAGMVWTPAGGDTIRIEQLDDDVPSCPNCHTAFTFEPVTPRRSHEHVCGFC